MIWIIQITGYTTPQARPADKADPSILAIYVRDGIDWRLDDTDATEAERLEWREADRAMRITRACQQGRPIEFGGVQYFSQDPPDMAAWVDVFNRVHFAIATAKRYVGVVSDDASGVKLAEIEDLPWPPSRGFPIL